MSTGVEVGVTLPVLNAPFRIILAWNPKRIERRFLWADDRIAVCPPRDNRADSNSLSEKLSKWGP